jgi:cystathionine beta-lyase/cystathionine gamma-synthase
MAAAIRALGGAESLIFNPARMTHAPLTAQERHALGISDDLLRLSIGIEDVDDLIFDLTAALDSSSS